jgi:hypothetical protein
LLALAAGSVLLADAAWKSVTSYESPYAVAADLNPGEPLTERLVLVVLDGIRRDVAEDHMPRFLDLAKRGNHRTAKTVLPSLSNPARATFVTGAGPDVHGVTNNGRYAPPPVQSLFLLAEEHGVPTAVYGSAFWGRAFGQYLASGNLVEFEKEQHEMNDPAVMIAWQNRVCDELVPFLAARPRGLLVAGLTVADEAGHDWGGESEQYRQVAAVVDACLGRLVDALDDGKTTFLLVSDHGHIQRRGHGGHGGAEPEVTAVPLVLVGRGVRPGSGIAYHTDVAPTAAALLGLPIPSSNQGAVLFDALELSDEARTALEARMVAQGRIFAERTPKRGETESRERKERLPASLAAGAALIATLVLSVARIGIPRQRLFWAATTFIVAYFGAFYAFGLGYSLSAIIEEAYLNSFFARNVAAAAIAFVCAALVAKRGFLWLGLLIIPLFGLRVALIHYRTGLIMGTLMPDLDLGLTAYLDLLAIFGVAVAACLTALVSRFVAAKPAS